MMDEIIDLPRKINNDPVYLKRSAKLFRICCGLVVFSIVLSAVIRPLLYELPQVWGDLLDFVITLPVLCMFALAPMGLYYSWKSYKRKEVHRARLKYALGHLFFCVLIVLFLRVFVMDILPILF